MVQSHTKCCWLRTVIDYHQMSRSNMTTIQHSRWRGFTKTGWHNTKISNYCRITKTNSAVWTQYSVLPATNYYIDIQTNIPSMSISLENLFKICPKGLVSKNIICAFISLVSSILCRTVEALTEHWANAKHIPRVKKAIDIHRIIISTEESYRYTKNNHINWRKLSIYIE